MKTAGDAVPQGPPGFTPLDQVYQEYRRGRFRNEFGRGYLRPLVAERLGCDRENGCPQLRTVCERVPMRPSVGPNLWRWEGLMRRKRNRRGLMFVRPRQDTTLRKARLKEIFRQ